LLVCKNKYPAPPTYLIITHIFFLDNHHSSSICGVHVDVFICLFVLVTTHQLEPAVVYIVDHP